VCITVDIGLYGAAEPIRLKVFVMMMMMMMMMMSPCSDRALTSVSQ